MRWKENTWHGCADNTPRSRKQTLFGGLGSSFGSWKLLLLWQMAVPKEPFSLLPSIPLSPMPSMNCPPFLLLPYARNNPAFDFAIPPPPRPVLVPVPCDVSICSLSPLPCRSAPVTNFMMRGVVPQGSRQPGKISRLMTTLMDFSRCSVSAPRPLLSSWSWRWNRRERQ